VTPEQALVTYRRSGGREPSDDERLDVWPDGRFEARRSVGGRRIGRFAGRLDDATRATLESAARAAAAADDLAIETPMDGATVSLLVDGREARMGSNEQPGGPWGELADTVRSLLDGPALAHPVAALELQATRTRAQLRHVGSEALEVDPASLAVRAVRLDGQGLVLGRWQGSVAPAAPEDAAAGAAPAWMAVEGDWQLDLPFRHGLELMPDDWLQVWVTLRLREGDQRRTGRLFVAVPGDAGAPGTESERAG
jgi:hypothetical protein